MITETTAKDGHYEYTVNDKKPSSLVTLRMQVERGRRLMEVLTSDLVESEDLLQKVESSTDYNVHIIKYRHSSRYHYSSGLVKAHTTYTIYVNVCGIVIDSLECKDRKEMTAFLKKYKSPNEAVVTEIKL